VLDYDREAARYDATRGGDARAGAAAQAIEVLLGQDWRSRVAQISAGLADGLEPARALPGVTDVRVCGAIGVIECDDPVDLALATPAALQSGAADAVGAAITVAARPASKPQPAACRRSVLSLKFIIVCFLQDAD